MNVIINEVYPSLVAGMVSIKGKINDQDFNAEIYPGTHKLEMVKIEDTYVYVEDVTTVEDVKFEAAPSTFIFKLQQQVKKLVETINAR